MIWKGGEKSKKKKEVEEKLLAAFAKDIDAKVEEARRETERREGEQRGMVRMPLREEKEGEAGKAVDLQTTRAKESVCGD